jgi:photosystem II stability/assembly factor-like uncharacterized protein
VALERVSFPDCLNGWAVGNIAVQQDAANGFTPGESVIVHTSNGGVTWTPQQTSISTSQLESVFFLDDLYGWAGGPGYILYTTNGGVSWTKTTTGVDNDDVEAIQFVDRLNGWNVGENGNVQRSTDGGKTWVTKYSPGGDVENFFALDKAHAWAVASASGAEIGSNRTGPWTAQTNGVGGNQLEGIQFARDGLTGWASGDTATLLHTTDGGATWTTQTAPTTISNNETNIGPMAFPDATNGWAVTDNGDIIHTSSAGNAWSTEVTGSGTELSDVKFPNTSRGWAVGNNGTILRYTGAPTFASITPTSGPTAGGTPVTIKGCGFTGATAVNFGSVAGTNLTVVDDATITVTSPSGTGTVDTTVVTPAGTSAVLAADRFTFVAPAPSPSATPTLPKAGGETSSGRADVTWLLIAVLAVTGALGSIWARRRYYY